MVLIRRVPRRVCLGPFSRYGLAGRMPYGRTVEGLATLCLCNPLTARRTLVVDVW